MSTSQGLRVNLQESRSKQTSSLQVNLSDWTRMSLLVLAKGQLLGRWLSQNSQTKIVAEKPECKTVLDCTPTNAKQFTESHTSGECKGTFWNYNLHWLLSHLRITPVVTFLIGSSPLQKGDANRVHLSTPSGRQALSTLVILAGRKLLPCQGLTT